VTATDGTADQRDGSRASVDDLGGRRHVIVIRVRCGRRRRRRGRQVVAGGGRSCSSVWWPLPDAGGRAPERRELPGPRRVRPRSGRWPPPEGVRSRTGGGRGPGQGGFTAGTIRSVDDGSPAMQHRR
jgi:hypothetical protein